MNILPILYPADISEVQNRLADLGQDVEGDGLFRSLVACPVAHLEWRRP